jgi:hypothetical protein
MLILLAERSERTASWEMGRGDLVLAAIGANVNYGALVRL